MVRILHVVTNMDRGGLETMIMNYYRFVDREKLQFDFLVHRQERAAYDDEIEKMGGIIYRVPKLNPFSLIYKAKLRFFFKQHIEYKIIHVHQDCLSSVILKTAMSCGVPIRIAHSHSSKQDINLKYPIKLFYKQFIDRYATDLFACGEDAGKWMFSCDRFTVLNNAIDAKKYAFNSNKRFDIRKSLGIQPDEILVGHVGRFSAVKNHFFLINVFAELNRRGRYRLLLVGDGELRATMEEKVERLELSDKVIFAGVRDDVADLMQAMDIIVFPSHYEGLPLTLIEAQAAGLPCLISDQVPAECIKTSLIQQLPLIDGAEKWAEATIKAARIERKNTYQEISDAGFDIVRNAKWLEEFYFERSRKK